MGSIMRPCNAKTMGTRAGEKWKVGSNIEIQVNLDMTDHCTTDFCI